MAICNVCGVELDTGIATCPLCGTPVSLTEYQRKILQQKNARSEPGTHKERKHLLQRILWQVTSILLLSGIVATLIIDLTAHRFVTWSVYPVSVCMIIFSYASLLAFWHTRTVFQLLVGWIISTAFLFVLNSWLEDSSWAIQLAAPILFAVNAILILLVIIFNSVKVKGLNILALVFVSIAVLCIAIEGVISSYFEHTISLQWSIIVAACLLPVTAAIMFMYFRTRKNADLQKIFHT